MARRKHAYRLQIVLDQKIEARDEAALLLAEKRDLLKREQEKLQRLEEELRANQTRRNNEYQGMIDEGLRGGLGVHAAQGRLAFIKRLDREAVVIGEQIARQKARVEAAEREVEEALEALIQASRELEVMEKHKERFLKKLAKEIEEKEAREMNEIGNVLYNARRREAHGG